MECHTAIAEPATPGAHSIALVGHPNVGKSVLFQRLTGKRVTVSNYPGTTVEIARAALRHLPGTMLVDTPGVIAFPPRSDDERVTERLLFDEPLQAVLQVGDAKNLRRTLLFTVQLAEMGVPLVLALNMMDEAEARGVILDPERLAERLGLPVIPATAVKGRGVEEIRRAVEAAQPASFQIDYPPQIEAALTELLPSIPAGPLSRRATGLLWLNRDAVCETWLQSRAAPVDFTELERIRREAEARSPQPLGEIIQARRLAFSGELADQAIRENGQDWRGRSAHLGELTTHPLWGLIILAGVLYLLYWFVGVLGAGVLVGWLENDLFSQLINPWLSGVVHLWVPVPLLQDLLVGPYGLWSMGMTYALALILPIVSTFFLAFGVMEDSGYLPRLSALSNRLFRMIGLNGKAVLPMVLGLGCVTMGTLTTRVLDSKRDRLLVTLLLALAIPCSAQLGVVMGMLSSISLGAVLVWFGVVLAVLLGIGWLAARLVPGERQPLMVELPPMRMPVLSNVVLKTLARLEWYLKEVVPLFLVGTAILFVLDKAALLGVIADLGKPVVTGWLGLPPEVTTYFIMGFLRRDFGATGLFIMQSHGQLSPAQTLVAMVTITLFIPCVASVMMIAKERSWRSAAGILALVFFLAFLVGGLLHQGLSLLGMS